VTIHLTTNFAIAHIDVDTPLVDLAEASRQAAETIDAALTRGGIAPPAAQDLVAVAARVTELEGRGQADRKLSAATTPIALSTGGAYTQVTDPGSLVLPAEAGQWVQLGVSYACDNGAGDLRIDFASLNGAGAVVSYISDTGAAGHGVLGMGAIGGRYETSGGSVPYQLKAADVINGAATFRLLAKADANGPRQMLRTTLDKIMIWGHVL
jgi:hypothetical protein